MVNRQPLRFSEKKQVYEAKMKGKTLSEIAEMIPCSPSCSRKWWRVGRDFGLAGLKQSRCGRHQSGRLSQFAAIVSEKALELKKSHPKWGPHRVLIEMEDDPELKQHCLPAPSSLAAYYKEVCPELLMSKKKKRPKPGQPAEASGVHEIWQLDHQEGIRLDTGEVVTICNIRDPFAAAMIVSQAFIVTTAKHWRKLTIAEVQSTLRQAFAEWQTLPQVVQTDNEPGLGGSPKDVFPSLLTLWLAGLGIKHQLIRPACPTDQAQVERSHRTMNGFAVHKLSQTDYLSLQASLDKEKQIHNERFPSRASDCEGRPPLIAHPELLLQPRPYQLDREYDLFNLQYVADQLATSLLERKVSVSGQVSLGGTYYYLGSQYKGLTVQVQFDAVTHQWLFTNLETAVELQPKSPKHFSIEYFTGLEKPVAKAKTAIQLSFPALV